MVNGPYKYTPTTGEHTVRISLRNHPYYYDFSNSTKCTVKKLTVSSTIITPKNARVDKETTINGTLTNSTNNPVAGVTLKIHLIQFNTDYDWGYATTDRYGKWTYKFTPTRGGEHHTRVSLTGHRDYNDFVSPKYFFKIKDK